MRSRRRRPSGKRWSLGLCRFYRCTLLGLTFHQLQQVSLGLPLYPHLIRIFSRMYGLVKNPKIVRGVREFYSFFLSLFLFFSLSYFLFSEGRLGCRGSYRDIGYKKRLCAGCILGKWYVFWNNEPFIGNTDTVKLRIAGSLIMHFST